MQSHGGLPSCPAELVLMPPKVGSLDDVKTSQSDTGAARSMALDHLGVIASRLRSTSLKVSSRSSREGGGNGTLKPIEEVLHLLPSQTRSYLSPGRSTLI